ncbi:hypothetical protein M6B38_117855 [Iris pallida]|uniref:Uncharacterized protein n=1 Tax=Iris pallida TaxID=29817 RepID=A0AAX6HIF2_IRIPA|nr:hypothetical protein M6B38_117855 [Iris pallida]
MGSQSLFDWLNSTPNRSHITLIIQTTFTLFVMSYIPASALLTVLLPCYDSFLICSTYFYTVLDYGTRFYLEEGLQPRSLFGLRVVTRLSNGSQVAFTLCLVFHYYCLL